MRQRPFHSDYVFQIILCKIKCNVSIVFVLRICNQLQSPVGGLGSQHGHLWHHQRDRGGVCILWHNGLFFSFDSLLYSAFVVWSWLFTYNDYRPRDSYKAIKKRIVGNKNFREVMLALTVSVTFTSLIHHTFSFSSWTCNLTFFLSPSLLCHVGSQVLEACVKNCGHRFHVLVSTREFVEGVLVRSILPKNNPPLVLHDRVLSLIQVRDGIGTHTFSKSQSCVGIES